MEAAAAAQLRERYLSFWQSSIEQEQPVTCVRPYPAGDTGISLKSTNLSVTGQLAAVTQTRNPLRFPQFCSLISFSAD